MTEQCAGLPASWPLPQDHWIYAGNEEPPMPLHTGIDAGKRQELEEMVIQAGRYAIRAATRNGTIQDFDPDALIQCLVIGMLGTTNLKRASENSKS